MTESQLTTKLGELLRRQNALVIPQIAGQYSLIGVPDRLVIHRLWRGWIECKGKYTKITQAQLDFHDMLKRRGEQVAIVRYADSVKLGVLYVSYFGQQHAVTAERLLEWLHAQQESRLLRDVPGV